MSRFTLTLCLLLIPLINTSLYGCVRFQDPNAAKNQFILSEATAASSVSPDGKPLASSSEFLASTATIYVTARVSSAPPNTGVTARWIYVRDDSGKALNQALGEGSATVKGDMFVSFNRQPAGGTWGSGQYSVSLLLNGKEVTAVPFTIKPIQKAGAQAPTISFFKAVPEAISTGQAVTLSWNVSDASQVEVSTIGAVSPTGNIVVVPVNNMEYQLTAKNSAGVTSMKVNVTVTSFNSDKPELVITGFRVDGDKAYYKVKNIGGATAKQSTTLLYIQGNNSSSSLVDTLAPGEEREQYFTNFSWTYGSGRTNKLPVRVCADGLNQIGEYDDINNCLVIDW